MVVGYGRKSYSGPAEISSLFVPGLIRGLGTQGESKISSCCFLCGSRERRFYVQERGCKDVGANKFFCFVDLN